MPAWACSVFGCRSTSKEFSGFKFPSPKVDKERYGYWVHFCKRRHPTRADQNWIPTPNKYICERHFEPSCIDRYGKKRDIDGNPALKKNPVLTPDAKPTIRDPNNLPRTRKPPKERPYVAKGSNQTKTAPDEYQPLPLYEEDAVALPPSLDPCEASVQHNVMQEFQTMQEVPLGWCVKTDASMSAVQYLKLETALTTDSFSAVVTVFAVLETTLELKVFVNGRLLSPAVYPPFLPATPSALKLILQVLNNLQLCTGIEVGLFQSSNQPSCDRYTAVTGERFRHKACELVLKNSSIRLHDRCANCKRAYVRAADTELKLQDRGGVVDPHTNDKSLSREALITKLQKLRTEKKNLQALRNIDKKRTINAMVSKILGNFGEDKKESLAQSSETDQEDSEEDSSASIAPSTPESVNAVPFL